MKRLLKKQPSTPRLLKLLLKKALKLPLLALKLLLKALKLLLLKRPTLLLLRPLKQPTLLLKLLRLKKRSKSRPFFKGFDKKGGLPLEGRLFYLQDMASINWGPKSPPPAQTG